MATVGIDLGTTNSLVSVWQDDKCTLIPNNLGEYLTPSVVGIDENGEMLVGRTAKERLISHPQAYYKHLHHNSEFPAHKASYQSGFL